MVVALGGNAIARAGDDGTVATQYRRAEQALTPVADLICNGASVVLTHGNGPVVGAIVLRGELASETVPPTPLFIAGADSEGGIGLMLQQVLGNLLRQRDCPRVVASIVTQVVVDAEDPAFAAPSKPIGPHYSAEEAARLAEERGWTLAPVGGGGWRRVVPSPEPMRVVETPAVGALLASGAIPIACGGGGVPVALAASGDLIGVDAVIDKDLASAVLASALGATTLAILMEADAVYDEFGGPAQRRFDTLTANEAAALAVSADPGGMRPKLTAAARFANSGGTAIICGSTLLAEALQARAGTRVTSG